MVYDFSELNNYQLERLKQELSLALRQLDEEDWVYLYNNICVDDKKFPFIHENTPNVVEATLKDMNLNLWEVLRFLTHHRDFYSTEDGWFILQRGELKSSNNPRSLISARKANQDMANSLVENYAEDFDIVELSDVMSPYSAPGDDEDE